LITLLVDGDERWNGTFQLPAGSARWAPGAYSGLTRHPFPAPGGGTMDWSGEGRGCNQLSGTLEVRSVRYAGDELRAIDMSFVQRCDGQQPVLRGDIRWDIDEARPIPAPVLPIPGNLWSPPSGVFPDAGNAMYIASSPGDYIGGGWTWRVGVAAAGAGSGGTRGTVQVSITEAAGLLRVEVSGDVRWTGEFRAMNALGRLQAGYYGIVQRYPFHNPQRGGLSWLMESRGCNELVGWFVVDQISYVGDRLQSIDLRFAQHCEASLAALRGRIRWSLAAPGGTGS
jgi:hypothetical protein